jgi:hypothetical protein
VWPNVVMAVSRWYQLIAAAPFLNWGEMVCIEKDRRNCAAIHSTICAVFLQVPLLRQMLPYGATNRTRNEQVNCCPYHNISSYKTTKMHPSPVRGLSPHKTGGGGEGRGERDGVGNNVTAYAIRISSFCYPCKVWNEDNIYIIFYF